MRKFLCERCGEVHDADTFCELYDDGEVTVELSFTTDGPGSYRPIDSRTGEPMAVTAR